ncbi:MAG TPA: amino acid adenylation domain-containing protein [Thermoanaerobaculia bacterium]|nr:amino acid adenylation domain-containing protein [Thermoanaerobaculia bacterium]
MVSKRSTDKKELLSFLLEDEGLELHDELIPRRSEGEEVPLSFAQERLWFLDRLNPGNAVYNVPVAFRLAGTVDYTALEQSIRAIVARHEALRTTFPAVQGAPRQRVEPYAAVPLQIVDLGHHAADRREAEARRYCAREGAAPFDLQYGPLLRAKLLRLSDREHWLLLTLHHIIADGWSLGVFFQELSALYAGFRRGSAPLLDELPIQFPDYALWQRRAMTGAALQEHLAYWRDALDGMPEFVAVPTDRPRPAVQTFHGGRVVFTLPREVVAPLEELSRAEGSTLFLAFLAGFQAMLSRFSGQDDIVVGSPVANRDRLETEGLIGFFVNSVLLRGDLKGDPSFRELLRRLRRVSLEAYEHQDVPFEKIVEELRPARDLSRPPLFNVMFGFQPIEQLALDGLECTHIPVDRDTAKVDLMLWMMESGGEISGELEFNTDLFDHATAERVLEQAIALFRAAGRTPDRPLSTISLLSDAERHRLLTEWSQAPTAAPVDRSIVALFEQAAVEHGRAIATSFGGRRWTYAELNARANRLARALAERGAAPGALVGFCLERTDEMVVTMLAILKTGSAYVPLDVDYPVARLQSMIEDAGVRLVVTQSSQEQKVAAAPVTILSLDRDAESIARYDAANLPLQSGADSLAYVIYTSGSTGRPKGVAVPHRAVVRLVLGTNYVALRADDRIAQAANASFDAATFEVWGALLNGARLVGVSKETVLSPRDLGRTIRDEGITTLFITTAIFNQTAQQLPAAFAPLRHLLFGGEACDPRSVRDVLGKGRPERLLHVYGPTENTTFSTWHLVEAVAEDAVTVPIGRAIGGSSTYVLDARLQPVPAGVVGELYLGGIGLADGYLNRPELTAERFVRSPFDPAARLYKTGDLVRLRNDGAIEFVGRADDQVKIRGFRIELGEIESAVQQYGAVQEAVVIVREDEPGDKRLVAYLTGGAIDEAALRQHLSARLPQYMVPSAFVVLPSLPLNANGKIDKKALPAPLHRAAAAVRGGSGLEQRIAAIWMDVLKVDSVGLTDNFFDLGGHSLLLTRVHGRLREELDLDVPVVTLFRCPTIRSLVDSLGVQPESAPAAEPAAPAERVASNDVAVIGLSCRFPGARNEHELWKNLRDGVESVSFFTDDELRENVSDPALLEDPSYIRAKAILDDVEMFDAGFFGISPREAEIMDPQQRIFLELAWTALENAGYDSSDYKGSIGVFAGGAVSLYSLGAVAGENTVGDLPELLEHDISALPTRVSYKLDLTGPSLFVSTACSTSLVAIHLACRALLSGETEMALAGGVSVSLPQKSGYLHQVDAYLSPDGHCRAFDAGAQGTVAGNGAGIVVLKRLEDALRDGDRIRAVIKGTAINNDGAQKVGFTAPSVDGQARCIRQAQRVAGVDPSSITFIEAHGTGTILGDPIEVSALTEVFRPATAEKGFCALGSVKTNFGHVNTAAGVAGVIKTVLALEHGQIPPTLNFERPNPGLDLASGPFYVNNALVEWKPRNGVRRAGVSSFGIGGTNAHAILEQAPEQPSRRPVAGEQLLVLSARNEVALEEATANLAAYLREHEDVPLADVAYTLQRGRRSFRFRRSVVAEDHATAASLLELRDARRVRTTQARTDLEGDVVFMFPGGGSQYSDMGRGLYESEPVYREEIDRCAEIVRQSHGIDFRSVLYPAGGASDDAAARLRQTDIALPALFATEYALARLLLTRGVRPKAMIGHSLGEYVAACLAGVFTLEQALSVVALRGRLIERLPEGAMLFVPMGEGDVRARIGERFCIAAINSPSACVVSGSAEDVAALERELTGAGVEARRLPIAAAGHSKLVEPILDEFTRFVEAMQLNTPAIPFLSNVTGTWIQDSEAVDPRYWARHLRNTVRFADGMKELARDAARLYVEVGPGHTLAGLAKELVDAETPVVSTLRHPKHEQSDRRVFLDALGRLWCHGARIDWARLWEGEDRKRVPLPTYPFQRQAYWISSGGLSRLPGAGALTGSTAAAVAAPPVQRVLRPAAAGGPTNAAEEILAEVFAEALGVESLGIHDNFFELGGTSVIGIQIVAKARKAGLQFTSKQLFEQQTVAGLAAVAVTVGQPVRQEAAPVMGELALTPVQHWFFERNLADPHHWNLSEMIEVRDGADVSVLARAIAAVVEHHEALRLRFFQRDGAWHQEIVDSASIGKAALLSRFEEPADLESFATELQASLDLGKPPLLRAAYFDRAPGNGGWLLLAVHHLVADATSWHVLLQDIETAYGQLRAGRPVELARTSSLRDWSDALLAHAASAELARELEYWNAEGKKVTGSVAAKATGADDDHGSRAVLTVTLDAEDTRRLLQDAPKFYRAEVGEVLLTALVSSLGEWTGKTTQRIELELDGRDALAGGRDFSRTVGWFTGLYPAVLDTRGTRGIDALRSVKEQLRAIPRRGAGHGVLRYLSPDPGVRAAIAALPAPEVLFVYLGRFDQLSNESPLFGSGRGPAGAEQSPAGRRSHPLQVAALVAGDSLSVNITYGGNAIQRADVEELAGSFSVHLLNLIASSGERSDTGYAVEDFPQAALTQSDLAEILAQYEHEDLL